MKSFFWVIFATTCLLGCQANYIRDVQGGHGGTVILF